MARAPRIWRRVLSTVLRRRAGLKNFEQEIDAGGGLAARADAGTYPVSVDKIVGSVGRSGALRSDFFYRRRGRTITNRYRRIGKLMEQGAVLPPIDLYKLKRRRSDAGSSPASEYYVLDGHHRVAMARKLGQAYLDASVVEYQVAGERDARAESGAADRPAAGDDDAEAASHDADATTHDA